MDDTTKKPHPTGPRSYPRIRGGPNPVTNWYASGRAGRPWW